MPMDIRGYIGAAMLLTGFLLSSCSKEDNVVLPTTPQVDNQEVSFDFFERSIAPMETTGEARTRANTSQSQALKNAHLYSELEVCLIPKGIEQDSGYVVRQDSLDDDFGSVKMSVPSGEYTLVAIAAKTNLRQSGNIKVLSTTEMRFPNNAITDMAYASQTVSITKTTQTQSKSIAIKRGVSCFCLEANDNIPDNAASEDITITGNCGMIFNPSIGFCKATAPIQKTLNFSPKEHQVKGLRFNIYVLLGSEDVNDLKITATSKDKNGKEIKTCTFDNVHLVLGKMTKYTGPIFTYPDGMSFTVANPTLEDSGYGKNF